METQERVMDLDRLIEKLDLLMRDNELYADTTVTREIVGPVGHRCDTVTLANPWLGWIRIWEKGNVRWDGPMDWDIETIIRDCMRTP